MAFNIWSTTHKEKKKKKRSESFICSCCSGWSLYVCAYKAELTSKAKVTSQTLRSWQHGHNIFSTGLARDFGMLLYPFSPRSFPSISLKVTPMCYWPLFFLGPFVCFSSNLSFLPILFPFVFHLAPDHLGIHIHSYIIHVILNLIWDDCFLQFLFPVYLWLFSDFCSEESKFSKVTLDGNQFLRHKEIRQYFNTLIYCTYRGNRQEPALIEATCCSFSFLQVHTS